MIYVLFDKRNEYSFNGTFGDIAQLLKPMVHQSQFDGPFFSNEFYDIILCGMVYNILYICAIVLY